MQFPGKMAHKYIHNTLCCVKIKQGVYGSKKVRGYHMNSEIHSKIVIANCYK